MLHFIHHNSWVASVQSAGSLRAGELGTFQVDITTVEVIELGGIAGQILHPSCIHVTDMFSFKV